jgi:uncharacterized membrane protein YphA (DoxX/SURF4 family)
MNRTKTIAYWLTTAVIACVMLSGGAAELAHLRPTAEGMLRLGYPPYVMTILGVWKVLGAIVLLAPALPRLKEWAYAGVVFSMTGAVASHAAVGDSARHVIVPAIFALVAIGSWAFRPAARTLRPLAQ